MAPIPTKQKISSQTASQEVSTTEVHDSMGRSLETLLRKQARIDYQQKTSMEKMEGDYQETIELMQETLSGLQETVSGLQETITEFQEALTGLQSAITQIQESVETITGSITSLDERVTALEQEEEPLEEPT